MFPVHLANEYHSIQAPYIFENLPLFGALFCVWMLLILFLLFSKRDEGSGLDWENLALSCIFGLLFLGFWVVITPLGGFTDGVFNMAHVRWLLNEGTIPIGHERLIYFDFPGMHLLLAAISQVTNLGVFESRTLFLMINAALFCAVLYILFAKLMKSGRLAFLGVLLAVLGSIIIIDDISTFYPRALGFTLLAGFLVMLTGSETRLFGTTVSDRLLMLILFIAMTISYFATSFFAPLILLGIYAVQRLGRDTQARVSLRTIILLLFMVIAWEIYWTWFNFQNLAMFLPKAWEGLFAGEFLAIPLTLGKANIGGALPLWANITRSLWWALIVFGTILGLRNLFKLRELSFAEKILTGGLVGVILLTIVGILGTVGGQQFVRFLLYGPIFCVPILLLFLHKSVTWERRGITLLAVLIFVLALPTFLSSVNTVATDASYPYDVSAGKFLEFHDKEKGDEYILYSFTSSSRIWADYYAPDLDHKNVSDNIYYTGTEEDAWEKIDKLITDFLEGFALPDWQKLLVISEKGPITLQHLLKIPPDGPMWQEVFERLSGSGMVFNNGHVKIYIP
jgi:hypothetical protein